MSDISEINIFLFFRCFPQMLRVLVQVSKRWIKWDNWKYFNVEILNKDLSCHASCYWLSQNLPQNLYCICLSVDLRWIFGHSVQPCYTILCTIKQNIKRPEGRSSRLLRLKSSFRLSVQLNGNPWKLRRHTSKTIHKKLLLVYYICLSFCSDYSLYRYSPWQLYSTKHNG